MIRASLHMIDVAISLKCEKEIFTPNDRNLLSSDSISARITSPMIEEKESKQFKLLIYHIPVWLQFAYFFLNLI